MNDRKKITKYLVITLAIIAFDVYFHVKEFNFVTLFPFVAILFSTLCLFYYLYHKENYVRQGLEAFKKKTVLTLGGAVLFLISIAVFNLILQQNATLWGVMLLFALGLSSLIYFRLEKIYDVLKAQLSEETDAHGTDVKLLDKI